MRKLGAIEFGGTKTNVAVEVDGEILARQRIPTTDPASTVAAIADFFAFHANDGLPLSALGVGAFGPITLDTTHVDHGIVGATNKPGWRGFDLKGALIDQVGGPIVIDTDVAIAGVGEYHRGALKGAGCGVYLTVGTGVGAAILIEGEPVTGRLHPEIGHLRVHRRSGDAAASVCRFHSDCIEGLASGPAIAARFGLSLDKVSPDGPEFDLIADYLGQLCAMIVLAVSPHRIVLGGGVSGAPGLHRVVSDKISVNLNGYLENTADLIVAPALNGDSGIIGALEMARRRALAQDPVSLVSA